MAEPAFERNRFFFISVGRRICGLPIGNVVETMRPLPVEPIAGAPLFVRGVSIVRGIPTPVVDLETLFGAPTTNPSRFVTLRVGERQVALSVDKVLGTRDLLDSTVAELPPLLREASEDIVERLGTLDEKLLVILREGWVLPDEAWTTLSVDEVCR